MADADANISQQELKDNLDRLIHQTQGSLAVMVSHPELNQVDSKLLCNALWGVEDQLKAVRKQLELLNSYTMRESLS